MASFEGPPDGPTIERRTNVIEFPRRLADVGNAFSKSDPQGWSTATKERIKDAASRFTELTLATGGVAAWGTVVYETLKHLSPGHTIYDNPEMLATFIAGAVAMNGAGLLTYFRTGRESK